MPIENWQLTVTNPRTLMRSRMIIPVIGDGTWANRLDLRRAISIVICTRVSRHQSTKGNGKKTDLLDPIVAILNINRSGAKLNQGAI